MNWEVRTMRSVTSYFNPTLYRKTMGRFWPMWALYGLGWMFLMPLNMLNEYFDRYRSSDPVTRLLDMAKDLPGILRPGVDLACVGGVLCAMAVFSYLYNNRAASMLHALPMKRETLFTTQYLAGLSFMLLPHLAVAGLTAAVEIVLLPSMYWGTALSALGLWLVVQSGICLFFFSFAAFCAMFTGHILALPAFYSVLNALVVTLNYLITELVSNFLYGLPRGGAGAISWPGVPRCCSSFRPATGRPSGRTGCPRPSTIWSPPAPWPPMPRPAWFSPSWP